MSKQNKKLVAEIQNGLKQVDEVSEITNSYPSSRILPQQLFEGSKKSKSNWGKERVECLLI